MAQQQINITDPGSDRLADAFGKVNSNDTELYGHLQSRDGHPEATNTDPGFQSAAHRAKTERALDVETSQRVVYVSPTGSDMTGDGTAANRWATIQHAVNQARPFLQPVNGVSRYKIVCATGTYDQAGQPLYIPPNVFAAFNAAGNGGIHIISESGVAADVVITTTNPYLCFSIAGSVTLEKLTIENDAKAVVVNPVPGSVCWIRDCVLRRLSLSNGGSCAIESSGRVFSESNSSPTGRLFGYGLLAHYGGVIAKNGVQPAGATANELSGSGGVIR